MIEACHNCGSPWLESYGIRCNACGATTGLLHEGIPEQTEAEAEALDIIEAHQSAVPDPQPSAGEAGFFGAPLGDSNG